MIGAILQKWNVPEQAAREHQNQSYYSAQDKFVSNIVVHLFPFTMIRLRMLSEWSILHIRIIF